MRVKNGFPMLNKVGIFVTTYEISNNKWNVILTHIFWGKDLAQAKSYAHSHLISDVFFSASFEGKLPWKGSILTMTNDFGVIDVQSFYDLSEGERIIEQLEIEGKNIYNRQVRKGIIDAINDLSEGEMLTNRHLSVNRPHFPFAYDK